MDNTDPFDKTLDKILSGRNGLRPTLTSQSDTPLGTTRLCDRCKQAVEWKEYVSSHGKSVRYWSDCACVHGAIVRDKQLSDESAALQANQRTEVIADVVDLTAFTLASFDPTRLSNGAKLLSIVAGWLSAIQALPFATSYHEKPRACLYFYSAGKGRGKTHLAGAILNEARRMGKLATFADEVAYIEGYWAAPLEQRAKLSALPGEKAWLTVIDDLGQRENTGPGLRDAWYDVINPRWLKRGWTVITSNWTPDELLARGTINEATYSRMVQMTCGQTIDFTGADQRLPGAQS